VLVVVASPDDNAARALVDRWRKHGCGLLTSADLSSRGWRFTPGDCPDKQTAVVEGRLVPTQQIEGVLTLLPNVLPHELHHIIPRDREYVAQEMTAFLLAWLTELHCPVLNRPLATSLVGPLWPIERWRHVAICAGLKATTLNRRVETAGVSPWMLPPSGAFVTVVGEGLIGDVPAQLGVQAKRLAAAARAELLTVFFDGADADSCFLFADPRPSLGDQRVADAILSHLWRAAHREVATGKLR